MTMSFYAQPIDGIVAWVDELTKQVTVIDYGPATTPIIKGTILSDIYSQPNGKRKLPINPICSTSKQPTILPI